MVAENSKMCALCGEHESLPQNEVCAICQNDKDVAAEMTEEGFEAEGSLEFCESQSFERQHREAQESGEMFENEQGYDYHL